MAVDGLSISWKDLPLHVFTICTHPNQVWYPQLLKSVITTPEGHSHQMVMNGHLPLAAWPVSSDHVRQRDFLAELSTLSGAPGENQQKQHASAWKVWAGLCAEWDIDPFSAPLKEILEFLSDQSELGKQYRMINSIRSAISMTHEEIDGDSHWTTSPGFSLSQRCIEPAPTHSKIFVYVGCGYSVAIYQETFQK